MPMAADPRRIEITDPRSLRALAHPTRLKLLALLRTHGPLTATAAAELLGDSAGSASFHLRQLAKHGLVEEAGARHGRARPWRATAQLTDVPGVLSDPELSAAADVFGRAVAEHYGELLLGWLDRKAAEPAAWQEAAGFGDRFAYVTPEELARLRLDIDRLLAPFEERVVEEHARPRDARLVSIVNLAIPAPEPPGQATPR
jgi:DNA-binding transcriptional ArsR family regulator